MSVGDWANTTDFWTGAPPMIISAVKCNTMFTNAWRLLKGGERIPCYGDVEHVITFATGIGWRYYGIRLNDPGPWDRIIVREKIKTNAAGTGNITAGTSYSPPVTVLNTLNLDCVDYQTGYTWVTVYDGSVATWPAGNLLVMVYWLLSGADSCTELRVRTGHVMLYSSV